MIVVIFPFLLYKLPLHTAPSIIQVITEVYCANLIPVLAHFFLANCKMSTPGANHSTACIDVCDSYVLEI